MPINYNSRELKRKFIENLKAQYGQVTRIRGHGEVYNVKGKHINIRCRTKPKIQNGERLFWYDFNFNLKDIVQYVIFITTTEDYFVLIPTSKLLTLKDKMYRAVANDNTRNFYIDWDNLGLKLVGDDYLDINQYSRSFHHDNARLPNEFLI